MDDFRRTLNDSQLKAVTTTDGPVLVIAGAGSGKTRVIEYRVLNLIRQKVSPNSILLLTFTRKAAREMLSRASQHDPRCKNVDGGTFHSFAYRILKKYARSIGFPGAFIVLDESDAEEAVHRCAVKMGLYERRKRFPKKDTLRTIISMSVNKNSTLGEIIKKEYPHFIENLTDIEKHPNYQFVRADITNPQQIVVAYQTTPQGGTRAVLFLDGRVARVAESGWSALADKSGIH